GYAREYEIKTSRSDFLADRRKSHLGRVKHDELAEGATCGPTRFWFVTPVGLLTEGDIPEWAGWIEIAGAEVLWKAKEIVRRPAPQLHREKFGFRVSMLDTCYYRYHRERRTPVDGPG